MILFISLRGMVQSQFILCFNHASILTSNYNNSPEPNIIVMNIRNIQKKN